MSDHIGIVACSAEGAALCYRTICSEAPRLMGEHSHPQITMHTFPLAQYMDPIKDGEWTRVAELMLASVKIVAGAGADFAVCPDNTIHQAFPLVVPHSPIPWLHIADAVAEEAKANGYRCLGVLGTKYLMNGPVYPAAVERHGLTRRIPRSEDQEEMNRIIFDELVYGVFREEARVYVNDVIARLKEEGCDAAVLGCTEIPLLVDPVDCPLPTLDSTRLLARAALARAAGPGRSV